jgi:hypothetical protein
VTQDHFPYESTFLSTFGVALGMAVGQREVWNAWQAQLVELQRDGGVGIDALTPPKLHATPTTLSSYSDSHRDYVYGDALAAVGERGFIVEFKRELKDWAGEVNPKKKGHKIRVIEHITGKEYEKGRWKWVRAKDYFLYRTSLIAHWIAYGKEDVGQPQQALGEESLDLCFAPYLCLQRKAKGIKESSSSVSEFLKDLLDAKIGAPLEDLSRYLSAVREVTEGGGAGGSGTETPPNGVLTYIDASGRTRLIWFRSIRELITSLDAIRRTPTPDTVHLDTIKSPTHLKTLSENPKGPRRGHT